MTTDLEARFEDVTERIASACHRVGRRREDVTLVGVSKGQDVSKIRTLHELGLRDFGESYVQEWEEKADALPDDIRWHFVGHLQSNKARFVADRVALVHSVDRKSVMKELHKRSSDTCEVLLQVNIGDDPNKSGADSDAVIDVAKKALNYEHLRLRGLMTIPPYSDEPEDARDHFVALRSHFRRVREWLDASNSEVAASFDQLSMGMSADFHIAIEEGATIVRVGTALFGPRSQT